MKLYFEENRPRSLQKEVREPPAVCVDLDVNVGVGRRLGKRAVHSGSGAGRGWEWWVNTGADWERRLNIGKKLWTISLLLKTDPVHGNAPCR